MQEILATGFAVTSNSAIPEVIALSIEGDDGQEYRVVMSRKYLPAVLAEIQREVGASGSVIPMRPDELQLGRPLAIESTQVRPTPDGAIQLILFAKLDDQGSNVRSLPLGLTPSQASALAADLLRHSAQKS